MALRRRRKQRLTEADIAAMREFRRAASKQRVCANCGSGHWHFAAHHVVAKQKLEDLGVALWSPRNALRLCDELANNCHMRHEGASGRVPLAKLTDENVAFAFELLGPAAENYLRRRYTGDDPRVDALAAA